ncbi:hypothetical protein [Microlunatus speluncae]|uniref:hypothetical protein n=1 Tax=Microlunatus speluncae TaxID=2594267 RepID=UPI0012663047|nr:hypothetical protein [Microlunatus speluncae]
MSDAEKDGSTSFWKTLPGVLTAVAGLLTAVGGFLVVLVQVFGGPGPVSASPPPGVTAETSVAATAEDPAPAPTDAASPAPASTAPPAATSGPPAEPGVLHRDRLELRNADFADLETGRLGSPPPNDDLYLGGTEELLGPYGITVATGPISKATCQAALTDRIDHKVYLSKVGDDQWVCIQTKEGHLAGMELAQPAGPGQPSVIFDYVVWS